jgi:hypothetical protein
MARRAGISLDIEGDQVSLEWPDTSAAYAAVDLLRRFKPEVAALLSAERRAVVMWINENFKPGPAGRCVHCGGGDRQHDQFVALFVGDDPADIHTSCHPEWIARREAEARLALGICGAQAQPPPSSDLHAFSLFSLTAKPRSRNKPAINMDVTMMIKGSSLML